jgi:hypothetical protein
VPASGEHDGDVVSRHGRWLAALLPCVVGQGAGHRPPAVGRRPPAGPPSMCSTPCRRCGGRPCRTPTANTWPTSVARWAGGVTLNALVVRPGLVDAAVVCEPVSSDTVDNVDRWIRPGPERAKLTRAIIECYVSPQRNPRFWREVRPRTFLRQGHRAGTRTPRHRGRELRHPVEPPHGRGDAPRGQARTVLRLSGWAARVHRRPGAVERRSVRFLEHNPAAASWRYCPSSTRRATANAVLAAGTPQ